MQQPKTKTRRKRKRVMNTGGSGNGNGNNGGESGNNGGSTYDKTDYDSNDGMLTTVWGPAQWHVLHTMSFNYPVHPTKENKLHYYNHVHNLQNVLPCGKCRKNLVENFRKLPLKMSHLESRETFSKYIYDLHELVNTMLNKHSGLTFEEVRDRYEHFRSRCTKSKKEILRTRRIRIKKEKGCTEPLVGEKSKCILHIVPQNKKCETFQMDKRCIKTKKDLGG